MRKVNKAGIDLIKSFEGLSLKPYPDPGSGAEPYTIGYGSTTYEDGDKVTLDDENLTEVEALALLEFGVAKKATSVEKLITIPVNDNEFAAIVSFAYNCGIGNLSSSTLLKLLNAGADKDSVADQLLHWNKAAGKIMGGLTRRRQAERSLFLQPTEDSESLPSSPSEEDINNKLDKIEKDVLST